MQDIDNGDIDLKRDEEVTQPILVNEQIETVTTSEIDNVNTNDVFPFERDNGNLTYMSYLIQKKWIKCVRFAWLLSCLVICCSMFIITLIFVIVFSVKAGEGLSNNEDLWWIWILAILALIPTLSVMGIVGSIPVVLGILMYLYQLKFIVDEEEQALVIKRGFSFPGLYYLGGSCLCSWLFRDLIFPFSNISEFEVGEGRRLNFIRSNYSTEFLSEILSKKEKVYVTKMKLLVGQDFPVSRGKCILEQRRIADGFTRQINQRRRRT